MKLMYRTLAILGVITPKVAALAEMMSEEPGEFAVSAYSEYKSTEKFMVRIGETAVLAQWETDAADSKHIFMQAYLLRIGDGDHVEISINAFESAILLAEAKRVFNGWVHNKMIKVAVERLQHAV